MYLGAWEEMWWLYYTGTATSYVDTVFNTGHYPPPYDIKYRVCAYNSSGDGPWSNEFTAFNA